ncbi:uncharacterized protein ACN427_000365 isoform 2-T2 [Glossina fuscipes fuscipes]
MKTIWKISVVFYKNCIKQKEKESKRSSLTLTKLSSVIARKVGVENWKKAEEHGRTATYTSSHVGISSVNRKSTVSGYICSPIRVLGNLISTVSAFTVSKNGQLIYNTHGLIGPSKDVKKTRAHNYSCLFLGDTNTVSFFSECY